MDREVLIVLLVGGFLAILFTVMVAYFIKMTREV